MEIGYVTGTENSSPYEFFVRLKSSLNSPPSEMLRIGDIVKVEFSYGNLGEITIYGIVTEIRSGWDIPMIGYEEILTVEKGIKPKLASYLAKITTTRIKSKGFVPPDVPPVPGSPVELVENQRDVDEALTFDTFKDRRLPIGVLENGAVAYLDYSYILGENGGHVNISGQSGVASKTSYMTFLMRSIIDTLGKTERYRHVKPIFVVFNVKGDSLMFIDYPSRRWIESEGTPEGEEWRKMYRRLGVKPEPFENVEFYAASRKEIFAGEPDSLRKDAKVYSWSTDDFFDLGLFEMIFDPKELERNSNLMLAVSLVSEYMNAEDVRLTSDGRDFEREKRRRREKISDPFDLLKSIEYGDLAEMLQKSEVHKSTIKLLKRRINLAINIGLARIWKRDAQKVIWKRSGGVTVIDISKLRSKMQAIVVGGIIKEIMKEKEKGELMGVPVFILLDELNKYAPRDERSEIASIFRDVAERGRSFGVILIGAEQTASEVDYRVITQAATVVVGRQKWVELSKPEYGHLLPEQKRKAATLTQGSVIVDQPFMRVPLTVRFPFPAWAINEWDRAEKHEEENLLV